MEIEFYMLIKNAAPNMNMSHAGGLRINVHDGGNIPINDARIRVSYTGDPEEIIEDLATNSSGITPDISLPAPDAELSLTEDNVIQPYSEYNIYVTAGGYEPVYVSGIEILDGTDSYQSVSMTRTEPGENPEDIVIPAHTLYGAYPEKIPESEIKAAGQGGEIVLSKVVVPETVIVHDGVPSDSTAKNYYVPYADYIKNVASSEIYATWPKSTITANVLAIMSFTLNRVYTEWYRNKGYDFTITSSTAYDHKWIRGRNIFDSISLIVDEIFEQYLSRPNVKQPILTQYCDGKKTTCPGWMSQWGSKDLGDRGYSPIQIIRNYYGSNMYINTAEQISGIQSSWPGSSLKRGSRSEKVRQIQEQLDRIAQVYPALPRIAADGIFGPMTERAVSEFQSVFGLPRTGIIDRRTWYKISQIYVGVTGMAELK